MPRILSRNLYFLLFSLLLAAFISGCAGTVRNDFPDKNASFHLGYQQGSKLDRYFSELNVDSSNKTGFYPLATGHDALLARLAIIDAAEHSLDVQYYIYRDDETSQLMTWRLYLAAERGVRVRVLLDDMQNRNDENMAYLSQHPNIEIRLFNPHQYRSARGLAMLSDMSRLTRRMHNKSLTADSVAAIVGGRNIGNEYFSFMSSVEFADFDLLLIGNTVRQTAEQFDIYWNSEFAVPIELIVPGQGRFQPQKIESWMADSNIKQYFFAGQYDLTRLPLYQKMVQKQLKFYWGKGELWYDLPTKVEDSNSLLVDNLLQLLQHADNRLLLISPYFVPTEAGTQALIKAVKQGKKITVVTNTLASNDVFAVHGWYAKYRQALVEGGVELWEVKADASLKSRWSLTGSSRASLHAKMMLIDDDQLFVGSMNWDPRSAELNTELAVVVEQRDYVAKTRREIFAELRENAYQLQVKDGELVWFDPLNQQLLTDEPGASIWRKLGAWFAGWLPIEDQL